MAFAPNLTVTFWRAFLVGGALALFLGAAV